MTSEATPALLDFRSDTITRPDEQMRVAMARAEVGDNVIDVDPTVRELERRAAETLGMDAALWTPSGTMANLIALSVHLGRGDRFLATRNAHVLTNELGSAAWLAGGMPDVLEHDAGPGRPTPRAVHVAAGTRSGPYYALRTTLLCLENTHNAAGGAITPPDEHALLVSAARDEGLLVHLDGARLWNAAAALGLPPAALTVGVDTVSACFSKGLGAPVGSVVAGSEEFVEQARRMRQMLGGGVRQGGVLAAACLVALDRVGELTRDHANAKALADGLRDLGWDVSEPQTNIVLAAVPDVRLTLESLRSLGILTLPMAGKVRFVLHRDVSADDVAEALDRIKASAK
ncbi:threonine aldolase [Prauserella sp. PE36]|uniref:Aminotransferase class I/II-fold pyridoxal phosphate-dependent enzyme n=1 Tax=Prauserella endophytica TaxID=1592324 RepID=A0ABY2SB41_9PSEU|nr:MULTISPECIES: GntG family PLP-dependent aldolase [Prauserella]PXY34575.1 threonine aldolase [Prauserella coralliicola]RBM12967.1 threonine aldolase [Prauserella sp. PE36]TKG73114.1 aminotransferase class I/II-fold pyridoxal phosphate-dependent enzyme [Prauserella endophytica]